MTSKPRSFGLFAAALAAALLGAFAAPPAHSDGRLVQVDVIDRDTGAPLHFFRDRGQPVVAGRPGARYAVRVANRSGERVMVVVAIDGVNILTGETAALDQDGYVLEPWQTASLTGWRKSHDEVAAFEFTRLADSYAARTGRPDDVGVIGVATFRERPARVDAWQGRDDVAPPAPPETADAPLPAPPAPPIARHEHGDFAPPAPRADGATAPIAAKAAPVPPMPAPPKAIAQSRAMQPPADVAESTGRLGTGHGPRERSWVVDTTFDRLGARPQELVRIRYDSLANLVAAGIAPRRVAQAPTWRPRAFPGSDDAGFVPDPPAR